MTYCTMIIKVDVCCWDVLHFMFLRAVAAGAQVLAAPTAPRASLGPVFKRFQTWSQLKRRLLSVANLLN